MTNELNDLDDLDNYDEILDPFFNLLDDNRPSLEQLTIMRDEIAKHIAMLSK